MSCNSDELKGLIHDSDESSAKIAELKAYVDDELKNTKNWGSATFATLEQYQSLCDEVATLKEGPFGTGFFADFQDQFVHFKPGIFNEDMG